MSKLILSITLMILVSLPTLGFGQAGGVHSVPAIAAQVQSMQINEVIRTKVHHESDLKGAGIDGLKAGDDVELEKRADGSVGVKHLPSGQAGVLRPAQ